MAKGIRDERVLKAMLDIPRHLFFDREFEAFAYEDKAFPIGDGQTISQPYTVAKQTELLDFFEGAHVLELGTGSGYQCAVLVKLGGQVFSVERKKSLHDRAHQTLTHLNLRAELLYNDGTLGWPLHAPYDRIIVTAAAPEIPPALLDQLKPGGILVIPVGDMNSQQMLKVVKTPSGDTQITEHGDFRFVPLIGDKGW